MSNIQPRMDFGHFKLDLITHVCADSKQSITFLYFITFAARYNCVEWDLASVQNCLVTISLDHLLQDINVKQSL